MCKKREWTLNGSYSLEILDKRGIGRDKDVFPVRQNDRLLEDWAIVNLEIGCHRLQVWQNRSDTIFKLLLAIDIYIAFGQI